MSLYMHNRSMGSSMDQEQHMPKLQEVLLWSGWIEIEKFHLLVSEQQLMFNEFSVGKQAVLSFLCNIIDVAAS